MTETLGTMHWRALDRDGEDKCRLARHEDGYMLVGHARFRDGSGWAALDYVVRCGPDWLTRSADVTGTLGGEEMRCRITCEGGHWALNGAPLPELSGCSDIDFSFTPATNLMPLRRLPEVGACRCAPHGCGCRGPGSTRSTKATRASAAVWSAIKPRRPAMRPRSASTPAAFPSAIRACGNRSRSDAPPAPLRPTVRPSSL